MTDRDEAVRTLAEIVADICARMELPMSREVARQIARKVTLAEPAAPTVTREQAEAVRSLAFARWDRYISDPPLPSEWPAFFRSVADALEGE